jgi:hypothetical protein
VRGTWTLDFEGGNYTVTVGGHLVIRGTYTIDGSKITLADASRSPCLPPISDTSVR